MHRERKAEKSRQLTSARVDGALVGFIMEILPRQVVGCGVLFWHWLQTGQDGAAGRRGHNRLLASFVVVRLPQEDQGSLYRTGVWHCKQYITNQHAIINIGKSKGEKWRE